MSGAAKRVLFWSKGNELNNHETQTSDEGGDLFGVFVCGIVALLSALFIILTHNSTGLLLGLPIFLLCSWGFSESLKGLRESQEKKREALEAQREESLGALAGASGSPFVVPASHKRKRKNEE